VTETQELKLAKDMYQNMGARILFAEQALRSIALNHAEAARSGVTEALNCLDGKLPNSPAQAEWRARNIDPNKTATIKLGPNVNRNFIQMNADFVLQFSTDGGKTWQDDKEQP